MSDKNQNLNEFLMQKKRVQRMKKGLICILLTWLLALMLISITLIVKVRSLQRQIDIITENTIRSQQVGLKELQMGNDTESVQDYSSVSENDAIDSQSFKEEDAKQAMSSASDVESGKDAENAGDEKTAKDTEDTEDVKKVYLTFDDGPSGNTRAILDVLDKYQVKATFFVTGRESEAALKLYKEIVDRGHSIGMHSYSHKYSSIYKSLKAFKKDLKKIQTRIRDATGVECKLFRFPGGSSNRVSDTDMGVFIRYLDKEGITYFDWNVECGDATSRDYTVDEMVDNVMTDVAKFHTSVVLMHDADNKSRTVEALPVIIKKLQSIDAEVLPIDEKTKVVQHVSLEDVQD